MTTDTQNQNQNQNQLFKFDHTKLTLGAEFYEVVYGQLHKFVVTKEPVFDKNYMGWSGRDEQDREFQFGVTAGLGHYGPKIYLPEEIIEHNGLKFTTR